MSQEQEIKDMDISDSDNHPEVEGSSIKIDEQKSESITTSSPVPVPQAIIGESIAAAAGEPIASSTATTAGLPEAEVVEDKSHGAGDTISSDSSGVPNVETLKNVAAKLGIIDDLAAGEPTASTSSASGFPDAEMLKKVASVAEKLKEHDVLDEEIEQANTVKEQLEKELEENDGWVKILGNDSLMKKVIVEGIQNTRPTRGEICIIKLEGCLKDKEEVVFEQLHEQTINLGDAEVIGGLDLAIPLMCKGEKSLVSVAPRFAYGTLGLLPLVPPNASVTYTVELIDFHADPDLETLSVSQRREIGNRKRERGNWWYGRNEVSLSVQCYRRALEFLDEAEGGIAFPKDQDEQTIDVNEEVKLLFEDRLKTYNNMAAAQLKLEAYGPALKSVEAVLRCQPENVKALFRKGKILSQKGDIDDAIKVFREAVQLEPENKSIISELNRLSIKRKEERKNERMLYKRMFNSANGESKDSPTKNGSKSGFKKSMNIGLIVGGIVVALAGAMAYRYVS